MGENMTCLFFIKQVWNRLKDLLIIRMGALQNEVDFEMKTYWLQKQVVIKKIYKTKKLKTKH